jgi:hypothetical protein
MARNYKRDSRGRFAGGGGSVGGAATSKGQKAAATRATNKARADELRAKGTLGLGRRIKAKGFAGGKAAQERAGGLRVSGTTRLKGMAFAVGRSGGQSRARKAATASATKKMSRGATRTTPPAKTTKSPANPAKAKYRAATSKVRELQMYRGGRTDATVRNAQRAVKRMESQRGARRR